MIALGDGAAAETGPGSGPGARDGAAWPEPTAVVPLLAGRGPVAGAPAAYVCRDFTCRMPVTDPMELQAALAYPAQAPQE